MSYIVVEGYETSLQLAPTVLWNEVLLLCGLKRLRRRVEVVLGERDIWVAVNLHQTQLVLDEFLTCKIE